MTASHYIIGYPKWTSVINKPVTSHRISTARQEFSIQLALHVKSWVDQYKGNLTALEWTLSLKGEGQKQITFMEAL